MNADKLFDKLTKNVPSSPDIWDHIGDRKSHIFQCDDNCGILNVMAGPDCDMHAFITESENSSGMPGIRARTWAGGGRSERVRQALMLLALAIKADTEEKKS